MRKVKFRAWQNLQKEMLRVTGLEFKDDEIVTVFIFRNQLPKRLAYTNRPDMDTNFPLTYNGEDALTLMQYSGVSDMHGNEICEGDVLAYKDASGKTKNYPVRFELGTFYFYPGD